MKKFAIADVRFSLEVAETSVLINNVNAPAPKPANVRLMINITGLHAIVYKNEEINDKKKEASKKGEKEPKKLHADSGSKLTKVVTEPSVDYKN